MATLSPAAKGWKKELNLISWNGLDPKYDIRDWDQTHTKMGKGITLSKDELKELYLALKELFEHPDEEEMDVEAVTSEDRESVRKTVHVEEEIGRFNEKSPFFIQEIKNTIHYMNEHGYTEGQQRSILAGDPSQITEEFLKNEIESMRTFHFAIYDSFVELLNQLNEDELELFLLLIMNQ